MSGVRLLMEGGPHDGLIIERGGRAEFPPLIWQFPVRADMLACGGFTAETVIAPRILTDDYQRAGRVRYDPGLWRYAYIGRLGKL